MPQALFIRVTINVLLSLEKGQLLAQVSAGYRNLQISGHDPLRELLDHGGKNGGTWPLPA